MKKTRKWPRLLTAALLVLSFSACEDWGQMDPPAGTDIYPTLEKVATYQFEEALDPQVIQTLAIGEGEIPELVRDNELGSQVLHLNGGYAQIFNPMNNFKAQDAVSLTFLVKQVGPTEEEAEEGTFTKDLSTPIVSFENANATQWLYLTANGGLVYQGVDGEYSCNLAEEVNTGLLDESGDWHYVALAVHNDGYFIYVDGKKRIDQTIADFDCSKMVQFMAQTPYMNIGYGAQTLCKELWIDDVTVYRNKITAAETVDPRKPSTDEPDYTNWIIVGEEDNSAAFFGPKTDLFKLKAGETLHFGFRNYTAGGNNWENWVLVCTNGPAFGEEGYAEHFVLRADAYGWGDGAYNGDNISSDYDWDTFLAEINGAWVDLTITRTETDVNMTAVTTSADGSATRTYRFSYTGTLEAELGFFLTMEKAHLALDPSQVYVSVPGFTPYTVGAEDCSTGWWSAFSETYSLTGDFSNFTLSFTNNNSGEGANWNNWLLVMTDGGGAGSPEYFVLRSDAYGWGNADYNGDNISASFNWDTYVADMHGAHCFITLSRSGKQVDMTCYQLKADGSSMPKYTFHFDNVTSESVGFFLTCELANLQMHGAGYFPYVNQIISE